MIRKILCCVVFGCIAWSFLASLAWAEVPPSCKVLVVMTYHEDFFWNQDIKTGIETILADKCELKYVYLDVLKNPEGVDAKVQEAYDLYQDWQPDGVITADDDPQSKLVVPYLKDKVDTPVIFCGVNADPAQYGYPASNVSGILQRPHVAEAIAFVHQLAPPVNTVGVLTLDIPAGRALVAQIEKEKSDYLASVLEANFVSTMDEALAVAEELHTQCDALLLGPLGNLVDADGKTLTDAEVYSAIADAFGKPTFTLWAQVVPYGVLCAIADQGEEQGETAAQMLLQAFEGTPVTELPITQNKRGKRVLNVDVMKALGITPRALALKGVEIVKNASE